MTKRKAETHIFKVIFTSQGQVYEIYAAHVAPAEMFGFIEVEQILFGERSHIIVDSSEERLKTEFAGVKRVFIRRWDERDQGIPRSGPTARQGLVALVLFVSTPWRVSFLPCGLGGVARTADRAQPSDLSERATEQAQTDVRSLAVTLPRMKRSVATEEFRAAASGGEQGPKLA
jgi:hypothetical protein